MKNYNTDTDWTRNKNSAAIIYSNADDSVTEITLESFLTDSPENTPEMFHQIKGLSDKLYLEEDKAARKRAKYELPLYDWSEEYISEPLEEQILSTLDYESKQAEQVRREEMLTLVPLVLNTLTKIQRRRFLCNKVNGVRTREIAAHDGVTHQSVIESIAAAEKKIKIFLLKHDHNAPKHPAKKED